MKIRNANEKDILESLDIARDLKEWFTVEAVENMEKDFRENLIVAREEGVIGFLNYKAEKDVVRILWLGVDRSFRRNGIGVGLLKRLEEIAFDNGIRKIIVDTLSHEDGYEPYISTRNFYLKNGFVYGEIFRKDGEDEQVKMEKVL